MPGHSSCLALSTVSSVTTVRVDGTTALAVVRNCAAIGLSGACGNVSVAVRPGFRTSAYSCGTDTKIRISWMSATMNSAVEALWSVASPPAALT